MKAASVIARQVVSEASRRRLLLALVLLTLLVIALTVWGVSRIDDLRTAGQPLSEAQKKTIVSQLLILVMFMFSWVLSLAAVVVAFNNETVTHVGTATKLILPTDGLWRGAVWSLEPSIVIAAQQQAGPAVAANPFFAAEPPPAAYVIWAVAWIAAMLALAIWSFRSREV